MKQKLILRSFWPLLFISIISLIVFYVFQINSLAYENYLLKNQEKRLVELKKEKEDLETNFFQTSSLANLENYFEEQNFEKVKGVKYIKILGTSVVGFFNQE